MSNAAVEKVVPLLRLPSVLQATGVGRTTLYERIKDGTFTPPIKLGARASAWPANEVQACNDAIIRGSGADEIKVLVQSAFQSDKEGKINTGRVLALRRLDIRNEKWQKAMQAIGESLQVVGSKEYVRIYERIGNTDQYRAIGLDVAAV